MTVSEKLLKNSSGLDCILQQVIDGSLASISMHWAAHSAPTQAFWDFLSFPMPC